MSNYARPTRKDSSGAEIVCARVCAPTGAFDCPACLPDVRPCVSPGRRRCSSRSEPYTVSTDPSKIMVYIRPNLHLHILSSSFSYISTVTKNAYARASPRCAWRAWRRWSHHQVLWSRRLSMTQPGSPKTTQYHQHPLACQSAAKVSQLE